MRLKHPCRTVQRWIANGANDLPSALQKHIAHCVRCQRAWRLEQVYQQGLHAARSEPIPACEVPWAAIQARRSAQGAVKHAPIWRPYAYAGGFAVALVAAWLAWLIRTPQTEAPAFAIAHAPAIHQDLSLRATEPPTAYFAPERGGRPAAPKAITSTAPQPYIVRKIQRGTRDATTRKPASRAGAEMQLAQATLAARMRTPMPPESPPRGSESSMRNSEPFAVASLPLSQYELHYGLQVEYLPIRYGTPSSETYNERNSNDAIICSF
jgi:hypothetical protein